MKRLVSVFLMFCPYNLEGPRLERLSMVKIKTKKKTCTKCLEFAQDDTHSGSTLLHFVIAQYPKVDFTTYLYALSPSRGRYKYFLHTVRPFYPFLMRYIFVSYGVCLLLVRFIRYSSITCPVHVR